MTEPHKRLFLRHSFNPRATWTQQSFCPDVLYFLLVTTYTVLLSISGASLQHSTFIQGLTEWRGRPALLLVSGRHWTKRHYRKKCPIFILVIGFIVLGLRRTLRHNFTAPAGLADSLPCGSAVQVQQPGGSEAMRNLFVPG